MIDEILKYNQEFVKEKKYKQYKTSKYPVKKIAILTCMDTRLTELLPAALGIKNGDKVLFVEEAGRIYMMNSSMDALREAQRTFAGEAERLGLKNDDDVMAMIKELREEGGVK
mgnify:CR=1 FL=1